MSMLKSAARLAAFSALTAMFITIFRPLFKWLGCALVAGVPLALAFLDKF